MASEDGSHNLWGNSPDDLWKKVLDEVSSESKRRKSSSRDSGSASATDDVRDLELLTKILKVVKSERDATVVALDKIYETVESGSSETIPAATFDTGVLDEIKQAVAQLTSQQQDSKHAEQLKRLADHIEVISQRMAEQASAGTEQITPEIDSDAITQPLLDAITKLEARVESQASAGTEQFAPELDTNTITQPLLDAIAKLEARVESQAAQQAEQAEQSRQMLEQVGEKAGGQAREQAVPADDTATREAIDGIASQLHEIRQRVEAIGDTAPADASAGVNNELLFQILDQTKSLSTQADETKPDFGAIEAKLDSITESLARATDESANAVHQKLDQLIDATNKDDVEESGDQPAAATQESVDALRESIEAQREQSAGGFQQMLDRLTEPRTAKMDEAQFNELREVARVKPSTDDQLLTEMLGVVQQGQVEQKEAIQSISERIDQVAEATQAAEAANPVDEKSRALLQQIHDAISKLAERADSSASEQAAEGDVAEGAEVATSAQLDSLRELIENKSEGADQSSLLYEVLESVRGIATKVESIGSEKGDALDAVGAVDAELASKLDRIEQQVAASASQGDQRALLEQILEAVTAPAAPPKSTDQQAVVELADKLAGKLEGIESKLATLSQERPDDQVVLNEILQAVRSQADSPNGADTEAVFARASAGQQAMLERIEQSLQSLAEKPADAQSGAVLQNILDAVQTSQDGPTAELFAENIRQDLSTQAESIRAEVRESLGTAVAKNEGYDNLLLEILAGVKEAKDTDGAKNREQLLSEIAEAVKSQPDRESEKSERVLMELRGLVDASKLNQKTFERVLDALDSNTKAMVATVSASSAAQGDSSANLSYRPWSDQRSKDRTPMLVVGAVAAVLLVVVGLTIYNTVILNRAQDTFNATSNGKDGGAGNPAVNPGTSPSPNKDALAGVGVPAKDGSQGGKDSTKVVSKDSSPVTKPVAKKDGSSPANTKDSGTPLTKDGGTVATKDGKQPFNPFETKDGKKPTVPSVPNTIIQEIAKQANDGKGSGTDTPNTSPKLKPIKVTEAKKIVYLVHLSGEAPEIMPLLLGALNKSIGELADTQQFTVVFTEGQRAIEVPPARLKPGTNRNKEWVAGWMDVTAGDSSVRPASSPFAAIDAAMVYEPDLLWFFTDSLAGDQPGQVKPNALHAKLKAINADQKMHINSTLFVNKVAGDLLKQMSSQHGGTFNFIEGDSSTSASGN